MKEKSVFQTLSEVNVNEHVKSKGNLKYLSWTYAWSELMKVYPNSNYQFIDPVFFSDGSCEVAVELQVEGITRKMILPVMDHKNKSILQPSSRDISDARMRCLVKCIAIFGLSLYVYSGEDFPAVDEEALARDAALHLADSEALLKASGSLSELITNWSAIPKAHHGHLVAVKDDLKSQLSKEAA